MGAATWLSLIALFLKSAASVITLLREKRDESTSEHKLRRRLKPVLFALTAVGLVLGIFTVRSSDKANKEATQKNLREQQELQAKLDTSLRHSNMRVHSWTVLLAWCANSPKRTK